MLSSKMLISVDGAKLAPINSEMMSATMKHTHFCHVMTVAPLTSVQLRPNSASYIIIVTPTDTRKYCHLSDGPYLTSHYTVYTVYCSKRSKCLKNTFVLF